jgi:acyl-CoA synthetase (AMP-forming)/AMP-acid ligase II
MTEANLADLWEQVADAIPDNEAMVCGERRLTYAEADERATRLANHLAANGIGPGDHVAVYLQNGTEYLEAMLAAFKLRAVPFNVNYRYIEEELRYLLGDSDAKAVVFDREFAPKIEAIIGELPLLTTLIAVDDGTGSDLKRLGAVEYEQALAAASSERDFGPRSADDLYILYTGGTTGMPKGVMWRHEDIFFAAFNSLGPNVTSADEVVDRARTGVARVLPACPFMHGTAHWAAFGTLYNGGTVIIDDYRHMDPAHIWELVAREQVTFLVIVGDAMGRPLVEAIDGLDNSVDLSGLAILLSGGAILSPTVKMLFSEKLPQTLVLDGFGSSEAGGQGQMVTGKDGEPPTQPRFVVNDETTVLDDDFVPAAPGIVGKLARKGRTPVGYYKDPDKSAATFPVVDGVRWSIPGDHARIEDDGTITVLGRGSVSINSGGEKIYPEEVEGVLKGHDAVFDAVVVGVPDERWGERVVAVVQPRDLAHPPAFDDLDAHARKHISGYKAPRDLVLVDQIVRSPSGKPDYRWAKKTATEHLSSSA